MNRGLSLNPDLVIYAFFIGNDSDDIEPTHWVRLDTRGLPTRISNPDISIDERGAIRSRIVDTKTVATEIIALHRNL